MTDEERALEELPYTADGVVTGVKFVQRFRDEAGLNLTPVAATILTRLFSEAIKDEREKCAKVADQHNWGERGDPSDIAAENIAAAIRAMGDKG